MRRNLFAIKKSTHVNLNTKINWSNEMYDMIGALFGIAIMGFIMSPIILTIYLLKVTNKK
jgi:uncharacterized membrane protein